MYNDANLKFKKKSAMRDSKLPSNLEKVSRISINAKTGEHEFRYGMQRPSEDFLEQMAPIRASNLVWQLPYTERKSVLEANLDAHLNRISNMPSNLNL